MRARSAVVAAAYFLFLVLATGCGSTQRESGGTGDEQRTTARALAAVVEDHLAGILGPATSARPGLDAARAVGGVGAELRYRAQGEPSAPDVSVAVGTKGTAGEFTCPALRSQNYNGCVSTHGGVLFWEKGTPEEDPGIVYVALRKGPVTAVMFMSGPVISGDPRRLDLRISVDDLFSILRDNRVSTSTSPSAIRAGEALKSWSENG